MSCITERIVTFDALSRLVSGRAMALRIPNFADRSTCKRLAAWFTSHTERQPYTHEIRRDDGVEHKYFGVDRLGSPFNRVLDTSQDSIERLSYYAEALPNIRRIRKVVWPHLSPIDKLRLELDEIWPGGATLGRFEGRPMFFGIGRMMDAATSKDSELNPHIDVLPKSSFVLSAQFSANVYLGVPPSGGALEVWSELEVPLSGRPANAPTLTIQPRVGDLVIFNTWRLHAISRFSQGIRVSIQGFIGYTALDDPLLLWD